MVANREDEAPLTRKGTMGRRRRRWREPPYVWWIAMGALIVTALLAASWRLLLLALALWCLYELSLVPTLCRVITREGVSCREPVRGRLFACETDHQEIKKEVVLRLTRLRRSRTPTPADPQRDTGLVVWSPQSRGRLDHKDRTILVLAAIGTMVTLAGMVYGLVAG